MIQTIDLVYDISTEIKLCQRIEPLQIVHSFYQVIGKVEHSEITKMINILDSSNFVRVQVENIKLG